MKRLALILALSFGLAIPCAGEGFAQPKKEMTFSGTHYFSSTPKVFKPGPDQSIMLMELLGVRVNDSGDGP